GFVFFGRGGFPALLPPPAPPPPPSTHTKPRPGRAAPSGVLGPAGPKLVTPLLSYTDLQVVELGAGLGVPWELAWSCVLDQETQCGGCPACQRRRAAFRAAGVIDPVFAPAGVR
ncbi:MAG: 7-cyano-7-deazaguanine synthase, partial [Planctomycetota bacterium]